MYTKDKAQRITLRLNENQFDFVKRSADMLGVSPSEFLRMVVNLSMSADQASRETLGKVTDDILNKTEEVIRRENEETNINNQL